MNALPKITVLTPEDVTNRLRQRANPVSTLTSTQLVTALDAFDQGRLKDAALIWDVIEKRDDLILSVATKRKKAVARNGFEVAVRVPKDHPQHALAVEQQKFLDDFYSKLQATDATNENVKGGFKTLVRQMMDAVGKGYAVHEIIWQPGREGGLTAQFRFIPLWYFENKTANLQFLTSIYAQDGQPLKKGAWMITTSDQPLMMACSIAWMIKKTALESWSDYTENFGKPGITASTTAARGSTQFTDFEEALAEFVENKTLVLNTAEAIKIMDMASAHAPHEALVGRMDGFMSALWRGSDLSTISKDHGYGASVQQGETLILEEDDAEVITETLQAYVDKVALAWRFGPDAPVLAGVEVQQSPRRGTQQDMLVDQFLVASGMPLSLKDASKRYGRAMANEGEPTLKPSQGYPGSGQVTPATATDAAPTPEQGAKDRSAVGETQNNP